MNRTASIMLASALLAAIGASQALAHITLERKEVPVGSFYKAVLGVPHGCDGSATVKVSVQIPEGIIAVKPMMKPGWTLEVRRGDYAKPYSYLHGAKLTQGPKEVTWSGGNIPDAYYDEFAMQAFVAGELAPNTTLYFPVVQTCEKGEHRWIETPSTPKTGSGHGEPAPALKLLPAATKAH
ncbi:YcnI family protein [Pseudolabrys sp. FHR47]|uniref:YcnI family copper-binding membrane protein n=1 Tax=Pseudolabrys sp. FHR47 TaxID=2562284 RepID=UPI0010BEF7ED|nr:YcnI family protein [Pseudolabrys sp. FHR47]